MMRASACFRQPARPGRSGCRSRPPRCASWTPWPAPEHVLVGEFARRLAGDLLGLDRRQQHAQRRRTQLLLAFHRLGEIGSKPVFELRHGADATGRRSQNVEKYPARRQGWADEHRRRGRRPVTQPPAGRRNHRPAGPASRRSSRRIRRPRCPVTARDIAASYPPGYPLRRRLPRRGVSATGLPAARLRRPRCPGQAGRHPAAPAVVERHLQRGGRLHPRQPEGDARADHDRRGDHRGAGAATADRPLALTGNLRVLPGRGGSTAAVVASSLSAAAGRLPPCSQRSCSPAC